MFIPTSSKRQLEYRQELVSILSWTVTVASTFQRFQTYAQMFYYNVNTTGDHRKAVEAVGDLMSILQLLIGLDTLERMTVQIEEPLVALASNVCESAASIEEEMWEGKVAAEAAVESHLTVAVSIPGVEPVDLMRAGPKRMDQPVATRAG